MNANPHAPARPDLCARAPGFEIGFAARFAVIVAGLVALIARAFLRNPSLAPLIVPLCRRLTRTARRLTGLMSQIAAGPLPLPRTRPRQTGGGTGKHLIPATRAWLIRTLRHEAAAYASQLSHLLAEPGVSELLNAAPAAKRLLRPICWMLGVSDTPLRGVARQATGVFRLKNPESVVAPSLPKSAAAPFRPETPITLSPRPPPCEHLRLRWPWFVKADAKPA